ncbi:gluconokinase [Paracoccus aerodenitrificans]|uniref:gluconokinase n=1 Tax=Paracoccus aerodenitrificans TaxID=3017781 RepID=UPI0022F00A0D|nr:gluconokinase [Paracoccus aerodenitrificans]WBU64143.1 gluconokinase [Paracoccus aerodenitrificans]
MSRSVQHIVVMGVSGAGKSTTGEALAARLGWPYIEGDSFHPKENVEKMHSGIPLTDEDRKPWLEALAAEIARNETRGQSSVLGCSSLKRSYRDILRSGAPQVRFLHVHGTHQILSDRLSHREGHFFPPELLNSQLETLEMLGQDEDGYVIDMALSVEAQVDEAIRVMNLP